MAVDITALVALDEGADADVVRTIVAETPGIQLTGLVEGLEESWSLLSDRPADVLILACRPGSEQALWLIREVARRDARRPVVVLSSPSPNGFVRQAFDAGADDLLVLPEVIGPEIGAAAEQLSFAVEKAVARRGNGASASTTALSSLICVLGPKGGIGKTLTTANLAAGLASAGKRVTVVDLDLQFGDVGISLGLQPQRTVFDLVKSGGSLDAEKIEAYLTPHSSGVRVLMAPLRPDQASAVTTDFLRVVYPMLRSTNDYVIVDTPPGFTPEVIASVDSSTDVCMVAMLDMPSLKNTKLGLETLELMGYDQSRIKLVLNRADSNVGVTREDVEKVLGRPADVLVPSHRDVVRSINEGAPVVLSRSRSDAAKAFAELTRLYLGGSAVPKGRRRLGRKAA